MGLVGASGANPRLNLSRRFDGSRRAFKLKGSATSQQFESSVTIAADDEPLVLPRTFRVLASL
jgi:hypothetical protein